MSNSLSNLIMVSLHYYSWAYLSCFYARSAINASAKLSPLVGRIVLWDKILLLLLLLEEISQWTWVFVLVSVFVLVVVSWKLKENSIGGSCTPTISSVYSPYSFYYFPWLSCDIEDAEEDLCVCNDCTFGASNNCCSKCTFEVVICYFSWVSLAYFG